MDEVSFADRELDVMAVLWELGSGTVSEVRDRLPADLAYTTVLTILRNLEAKGFLRHEEEGKAHRYFPLVQRNAAERSAVARLVERLFQGSPELLLTRLVDDHDLSPEQLKRMRRRLKQRLQEGEEES
jgi:predicted transcriptional regulator